MNETPISFIRDELYAGYATDETIRSQASSGGIVSCILIDLLERGEIAGALVSRITSQNGKIEAITSLARTAEEIMINAGSSYVDTPVLQKVNELIDTPGRVAVVALPCQVRALRAMMARRPEIREKFYPIIGLFCRGNVNPEFYQDYFKRNGINPGEIEQVKISRGHTQGSINVKGSDGSEHDLSFMKMNVYRVAGIHAKALCGWCDEHLSAEADVSIGDIFTREYKSKTIKHSAFVPRDDKMAGLLEELSRKGKIKAEYVGMQIYQKTFANLGRFTDTLASRYVAAKLVGIKSPRHQPAGRINLFHVLAWMIYYINGKLSQSEKGRRFLFKLPAFIVTLVAYIFKGLSRF